MVSKDRADSNQWTPILQLYFNINFSQLFYNYTLTLTFHNYWIKIKPDFWQQIRTVRFHS